MIVWGGVVNYSTALDSGGLYDPATDRWTPTDGGNYLPAPRRSHSAVWTGSEMIVWGGYADDPYCFWLFAFATGGRYFPNASTDYLAGQGLAYPNENEVKVFSGSTGTIGADFLAYGAGHFGVNVASGDLDGGEYEEILTGPGPGAVFGPQVKAFDRSGKPLSNVNFYAYGTLHDGANVGGAELDADGFSEILSGPGPGTVFGPHVRAFDVDNGAVPPIAAINFFGYRSLKFGVKVARGDVDADGFAEILLGPGPGPGFAPEVRGFDYDGTRIAAIPQLDYYAFQTLQYGVNLAGGEFDGDGFDEIAAAPGPGGNAGLPSRFRGHDFDGIKIASLPGFDITPFSTVYGGRVGAGDVSLDGRENLVAGAGPDPTADATVKGFSYAGRRLSQLPASSNPFPGHGYGVNATGAGLGY